MPDIVDWKKKKCIEFGTVYLLLRKKNIKKKLRLCIPIKIEENVPYVRPRRAPQRAHVSAFFSRRRRTVAGVLGLEHFFPSKFEKFLVVSLFPK